MCLDLEKRMIFKELAEVDTTLILKTSNMKMHASHKSEKRKTTKRGRRCVYVCVCVCVCMRACVYVCV